MTEPSTAFDPENLLDTADLVAQLEGVGVELWLDGPALRYRAPNGVMTPDRLATLRSRRDEIVVLLTAEAEAGRPVHDPRVRFDPFPLTEVQSAYLTGRRGNYPYGGVGCHGYGELEFHELDPVRLGAAWRRLIARHDMLRTLIDADGSQQVLPEVPEYQLAVRRVTGPLDGPVSDVEGTEFQSAVLATRAELDHRVYQAGEWPLFDLRLTMADDVAVLHFSIDFLIADFVSLQILLQELEFAYQDAAAPLPALDVTFRDLLLADRTARSGVAARRDRAYWWARIDALPGPPELPVLSHDRATPRFHRFEAALSDVEWSAFRARSGEAGVTPSCAVLATYAEVIGRWTRRPGFTLNVTVLNRPPLHPQINQLVGDFTAVELLAVQADPTLTFGGRAQAVQATLWQDLDHRLFSGLAMMRELRRRAADGLTLFPVVFTSSVGVGDAPGAAGGMNRLVHGISQTPQVWLDCQVMERAGGLAVNWDVREGVFAPGVVEAMFAAFETLLRELAAGPGCWNSTSPVPVPAGQLARRPQPQTSAGPSTGTLLQDGVLAQAAANPSHPAVISGERTLSFGELARQARAVAQAVVGWGCAPGSAVAIEMDKGWEQIAAVLGVLMAGCWYVPVDTAQPISRRDRMLADVDPAGVLTQSWLADQAGRGGRRVLAVDTLDGVGGVDMLDRVGALAGVDWAPAVRGGPDDLAYTIYTSGSTGDPKGVMISHRAALGTIDDVNRRFGIGPGDRVLGLANLGFDLSVYDIFGLLAAGGCLVLPQADRRADPVHWADLIASHAVTTWNSVPAQLEMLVAYLHSEPERELGSLRLALLSGDWIPVTLPGTARERLPGLELISLGGATEAAIWSIFHRVEDVDPDAPSIPYGRPLTGQSVQVLGADLQPVPDLVPGELYIGGTGLSAGYLGDDVKTAERFIRHPATGQRLYRTGDLGRFLADGSIEFLGREDSQVKIRGHRVELAEIEGALVGHHAVHAAAVVPVGRRPEPLRLAAFVEPAYLAPGEQPAGVEVTELGKSAVVDAAELRAEVDDEQMLAFARQLDRTALQQMLAALRHSGSFAGPDSSHSQEEILAAARVAPRHHRLVRRWLRALTENGLISRDPETGRYTALTGGDVTAGDDSTVQDCWRRVEELVPDVEARSELITYFKTTADNLPELLTAELDPLTLLFPEGRTEIHEVAYTAMFLSRYVNRLLTSVARTLVSEQAGGPEPVQILEVGAGVGGTSVELIPVLDGFDVRYRFTDVSEFFLNNARKNFSAYPWVDFGKFDMNRDYREQGLQPNSYHLIVCANVLHYARGADATLAKLKELLVPGGWLLFIEATRDSYQIMTSMEFLFDEAVGEFDDVRKLREQTFLTREQWLGVLANSAAGQVLSLPDDDPITDEMGMHVFAAQYKADRAPVARAELGRHLTEQLPEHMLPFHLQVVDHLPLSTNGKVDREALRRWLPAADPGSVTGSGEAPVGETEERLAAVWQQLLGLQRIGRHQNFFELGGDSLLAAQLATQIREDVPLAAEMFYDNLLRLILESSTVASLADRISAEHDQAGHDQDGHDQAGPDAGPGGVRTAVRPSPLVTLGGGQPAGAGMVVLVHDGTGSLAAYQPLLERLTQLADGARLTGLVLPDPERYLATGTGSLLEEIGADYARAIREAGTQRLQVIGHQFGGVLAAEVCRQLAEVGIQVERLVIVATGPSRWTGADDPQAEQQFCEELGIDSGSAGLGTSAWFGTLAGLVPDLPLADAYRIFRHSAAAAAGQPLLPYAGDVTLIRPLADEQSSREDAAAYWDEVCLGDLQIIDVPYQRSSCIREAAPFLADLIGERLVGRTGG